MKYDRKITLISGKEAWLRNADTGAGEPFSPAVRHK